MPAVIEFGFNATPVFSGVDRLEQRLTGLDSRVARSGEGMMKGIEKSSGGTVRSLGQVSMQVQDIAVQLQMGAKVSTVLAQQGSQILSRFGAGGAIAGGVVAIGGAFLSMMDASRKAFDEANKGQKTFLADLDKIVASGGYTELLGGLDGIASRMTAMQPVVKTNTDSLIEFAYWVDRVIGRAPGSNSVAGPTFDQRFFQQEDFLDQLAARQDAVTAQAIRVAQEQTQIAEARARGETEVADAMEQQLKLAQEIARIGNMTGLTEEARSVLADEAKRKSEAQAAAKAHEKSRREMEAAADAQERLDSLKQEMSDAPLSQRIQDLRDRIANEQATPIDPFGDPFALATQKEIKVLELQKQLNQLIKEEKQAAKEAANEQKRKADEMARAAKEQADRDEARKRLQEDVAIAKAKQEGDMDKAAKLQQQADLRRKTNEIMDATGLNKSQAKAAAWSLVGDSSSTGKSKIKSRLMGGPDEGPLGERRPGNIKAHLMGGHLSDYEALQLGKTGTLGSLLGPSAVGMSAAQNAANASRADAPATDGISRLVSAFKTEFGPDFAKQLVDALMAK